MNTTKFNYAAEALGGAAAGIYLQTRRADGLSFWQKAGVVLLGITAGRAVGGVISSSTEKPAAQPPPATAPSLATQIQQQINRSSGLRGVDSGDLW